MSWLIMIKWLIMAHGRHIATNVLWSKISLCYSIVILIIIHSSVLDSPKLCFNLILMLVGYDKLENVSWAGYNLRANINLGKLWSCVSACGGWSPTWIFSVGFYLEKEKRKNLYIDIVYVLQFYILIPILSHVHMLLFFLLRINWRPLSSFTIYVSLTKKKLYEDKMCVNISGGLINFYSWCHN